MLKIPLQFDQIKSSIKDPLKTPNKLTENKREIDKIWQTMEIVTSLLPFPACPYVLNTYVFKFKGEKIN